MKTPTLKNLHEAYQKKTDALQGNASFKSFERTVRRSVDNFVFQKARTESKMFDQAWVDALEEAFPHLDRIVKNPRNFIKQEGDVVIAALAKRVTPASIAHLASHTQFIRKVNDDGSIEPEKILSVNTEEDFQIYENRFVMTLIKKVTEFVMRRYTYIMTHIDTRDSEVLVIHSVSQWKDITFEVDNRVKISRPSREPDEKKNAEILARIKKIRGQLDYYNKSIFMKNLENARPVRNPIQQTNLIVKHPDYKAAYKLWRFIDKYDRLGVSFSVNEADHEFTDKYADEVYSLVLGSILTLETNLTNLDEVPPEEIKNKVVLPKVRLTLEDETFLDRKFAYHEFPLYEKELRDRKQAPKSAEEIRKEESQRIAKDWDESEKIEEIRAHEAAIKKKEELDEAARNAKIRKQRQKQLAAWEVKVAHSAKRLLEDDLRRAKKKKEKAEKEALLREKALLSAQRKRIKDDALRDHRIDYMHLKKLSAAGLNEGKPAIPGAKKDEGGDGE
jgi:hypothetical protein